MTLRRSGIRRTGGPRRHTRLNPRSAKQARRDRQWQAIRLLVLTRDMFECRMCCWASLDGSGLEVHHRLRRSQLGADEPENLVTLCAGPYTPDCHGWVHRNVAEAEMGGWLLRPGGGT